MNAIPRATAAALQSSRLRLMALAFLGAINHRDDLPETDSQQTRRVALRLSRKRALRVSSAHNFGARPLGQIYYLDDEWVGGWGRAQEQLEAEVLDACRAQLTTADE